MTPEVSEGVVEQCRKLFGLGNRPRRIVYVIPGITEFPVIKKKDESVDYEAGWYLYGELFYGKSEEDRAIPDGYELLTLECGTEKHDGIQYPVGYLKELDCLLIQCLDRL